MQISIVLVSLLSLLSASLVQAESQNGLYGIPLYRRDHPTDTAAAAAPVVSNPASTVPTSGKVSYTNNQQTVTDNYSPSADSYSMNDWVCVEDTGMDNDPAWAGLECVDDVMDDWECDYDPIAPPTNPTSPPQSSVAGTGVDATNPPSPPSPPATGLVETFSTLRTLSSPLAGRRLQVSPWPLPPLLSPCS
ncbi:hypothetical protein BC829DRAFT_396671, partial [Chytridium lagenaria]